MTKIGRTSTIVAALAAMTAVGIVGGGAPAEAAPVVQVERNVSELLTADNPEAVWFDMSAQEQDLVREELNDGAVQISAKKDEGSVSAKVKYSGCWTRAIEATFKGGVTKRKMFSVGQRTEVCAKKGKVTKVKVLSPYSKTYGVVGISVSDPATSKYNAGWEGRGVARTEATLGISIPKVGPIGAKRTICAKLYLNGNGKTSRATEECHA